MKAWFYENYIAVMRWIGTLLLLGGAALFFWGNTTNATVSSEVQRAAERVARMEARLQDSAHVPSVPKVDYAKAYSEHTKTQTRLMLILMILLGAFFVAYSFVTKRRSPED